MNKFRGSNDPHHSAAQTCADPRPKRPQGSNVRKRRQNRRPARSSTVPSRSVFAPSGGVPHRIGSPVQGREGRAEAWEAKFPERDASVPRRKASQHASSRRRRPAKGRETSRGADRRLLLSAAGGRLQPERSPRGRIQGGGELRTATPVVAPNSMPAVWRRGPRLVNVASGLAHRSAQHLTPLRGRPLLTEAAMEREGAEVLVQGPTLEARASSYGPEDPAPPDLPQGRPGGKQPRRGGHINALNNAYGTPGHITHR